MDWGELFGFLIFLAIGGLSMLHKAYEERKASQERQLRKSARPEDLPEATRKMLYGEGGDPRGYEPPVARPRGARSETAGPAPLPPLAQPRMAPPRRVAPSQSPAMPGEVAEANRKAGWEKERSLDESAPSREAVPPRLPAQPTLAGQRELVKRTMQQAWEQAQQKKQQAARLREAQAAARSAVQRVAAPPQPPRPKERPPLPLPTTRKRDLGSLLMERGSLMQGILMQEVLGPPRALRPYGE